MSSGTDPCEDVLREIIKRISLHKGILCCAIVCKQWRSIVMDNLHQLPHMLPLNYCLPRQHLLPLLMHFNDEVVGKVSFLSVLDNKSFTGHLVPEITGKWIAGSSNGCLVLTELLSKNIYVLNPLTRAQISLPSFFNFRGRTASTANDELVFLRKAVIISGHSSRNLEGCIVIAIISHEWVLSFCRPGDDRWTTVKGSPNRVTDVIYFKGQLYAVIIYGALFSFDVEHKCAPTVVAGFAKDMREFGREYLVESTSGNLLLIVRSYKSTFTVYKLEEVDETEIEVIYGYGRVIHTVKYVWVEVESLDDQILFLGRNCKSIPASLYPDLKGNCIYFTDDDFHFKHVARAKTGYGCGEFKRCEVEKYDMGIYDMEQKSIQPIGFMDYKLFRAPPVFVEPNLCLKNN